MTGKWLFSCVCFDMTHQLLILRKSFVTLGAGELLLPYVSFYMCPPVFSLGKSLLTDRAGVGLLSRMDFQVFVHGARLREGLVT